MFAFSKLILTIAYLITVAGLPQNAWKAALLFTFLPLIALIKVKIPLSRCLLILIPVCFLALGNLFFAPPLSGAVLVLKALACCLTALIFSASVRIEDVLSVLNTLKCPHAFMFQLFFICRYLDLITEEAVQLKRAFFIRSHRKNPRMKEWKFLAGNLLLRCLDRADRIHDAMICRNVSVRQARFPVISISIKEVLFSISLIFLLQLLKAVLT